MSLFTRCQIDTVQFFVNFLCNSHSWALSYRHFSPQFYYSKAVTFFCFRFHFSDRNFNFGASLVLLFALQDVCFTGQWHNVTVMFALIVNWQNNGNTVSTSCKKDHASKQLLVLRPGQFVNFPTYSMYTKKKSCS